MPESKKISFFAALLMSINMMIGGGIYIAPPLMTQQAGNFSFLGWILAALLLLPIVLTIAQAARIFPGEGGFYNYCKTALGEDAGFLANWAYLLGYMGTVATMTSVVRDHLEFAFIKEYPLVFYIVFIALLSLVTIISIRLISKIQSAITMLKLLPLMFVLGSIYFYWNPSLNYQTTTMGALCGTLPLALFAFNGFESCCNISHHIRGGSTKAFKVILLAFSITTILYTLFHFGILQIMGSQALAQQGVKAFPQFLGLSANITHILALFLIIDMMLSYINTAYGASLNNVTNINIFAKNGLLFQSKFLAKLNKHGMPAHATLVHAILIVLLVVFIPNTITLTALTILGVYSAFFLTLLAVLVQSWRKKSYGILIISTIGFASLGMLLFLTWTTQLGTETMGRLLYATPVIIGIPAGYLMYRWVKKARSNNVSQITN